LAVEQAPVDELIEVRVGHFDLVDPEPARAAITPPSGSGSAGPMQSFNLTRYDFELVLLAAYR
jgi:hypothetical protein